MNKFNQKSERGITLIALIITIIILVILAAVSIRTVYNMGIVNHAVNGTAEYARAAKNENNVLNDTATKLEETIANIKSIQGENEKQAKFAEDILIIDTAANLDAEKSPYINYIWKTGEDPILCRVLYDKDSQYGLQIISAEPVRSIKLGYGDEVVTTGGPDSYNRAIETLNAYAEYYMDTNDGTGIMADARCVGSNPSEKNSDLGSTAYAIDWKGSIVNKEFKNADTNYTTDQTALTSIGAFAFTSQEYSEYWLASRFVKGKSFGVRCVLKSGSVSASTGTYGSTLCNIASDKSVQGETREFGFRPVFILNSGVKITGGSGTVQDPYELGL